jgi:hypothetical protein
MDLQQTDKIVATTKGARRKGSDVAAVFAREQHIAGVVSRKPSHNQKIVDAAVSNRPQKTQFVAEPKVLEDCEMVVNKIISSAR